MKVFSYVEVKAYTDRNTEEYNGAGLTALMKTPSDDKSRQSEKTKHYGLNGCRFVSDKKPGKKTAKMIIINECRRKDYGKTCCIADHQEEDGPLPSTYVED